MSAVFSGGMGSIFLRIARDGMLAGRQPIFLRHSAFVFLLLLSSAALLEPVPHARTSLCSVFFQPISRSCVGQFAGNMGFLSLPDGVEHFLCRLTGRLRSAARIHSARLFSCHNALLRWTCDKLSPVYGTEVSAHANLLPKSASNICRAFQTPLSRFLPQCFRANRLSSRLFCACTVLHMKF